MDYQHHFQSLLGLSLKISISSHFRKVWIWSERVMDFKYCPSIHWSQLLETVRLFFMEKNVNISNNFCLRKINTVKCEKRLKLTIAHQQLALNYWCKSNKIIVKVITTSKKCNVSPECLYYCA